MKRIGQRLGLARKKDSNKADIISCQWGFGKNFVLLFSNVVLSTGIDQKKGPDKSGPENMG